MSRFHSKEQWQATFGNEGHFVLHNTRHTTKGVLKFFHCTYAKKAGWHHCPNNCVSSSSQEGTGGVVLEWGGPLTPKGFGLPSGTIEGRTGLECHKEGVLDALMPKRIIIK